MTNIRGIFNVNFDKNESFFNIMFELLPHEILIEIFKYTDVRVLIRSRLISKFFKKLFDILIASPKIDFIYLCDVNDKALSLFHNISNIKIFSSYITQYEMRNLRNVTKLVLRRCDVISGRGFANFENLTELEIEECPLFDDQHELEIYYPEKLQKLVIVSIYMNSDDISKMINLERLEIWECTGLDDAIFKNLRKLKYLIVDQTSNITLKNVDLSNLEYLSLTGCKTTGITLGNLDKLKYLFLELCVNIDENIFRYTPNVEELELYSAYITGKYMHYLTKLKRLKIMHSSNFDEDNLNGLNVEYLKITKEITGKCLPHLKNLKEVIRYNNW